MSPLPLDDRRVLHVVTSTQRRGAEIFATDLAQALGRIEWPGEVFALADHGPLQVDETGRGRFHPSTIRALRSQIQRSSVVIAHGSSTLLACSVAAAGTRIPYLYRTIGDPDHWVSTPLRALRVGIMLRHCTRVVALWPSAAGRLQQRHRLRPDRVAVVPNAVDASRFGLITAQERGDARARFGLPASAPVACFIGALTPEKNPELAVQATAAMPEAHLLLVGDGPLRAEVHELAARCMPRRSVFLPTVDDVRPLLAAADVLVLTSLSEGLPGVLIEAGLRGLPTVASCVGGIAEIVQDGETGLLVRTGDRAAFTSAIREALHSKEELGLAARAHCREHFDLARVAAQWAGILEAVEAAQQPAQ